MEIRKADAPQALGRVCECLSMFVNVCACLSTVCELQWSQCLYRRVPSCPSKLEASPSGLLLLRTEGSSRTFMKLRRRWPGCLDKTERILNQCTIDHLAVVELPARVASRCRGLG